MIPSPVPRLSCLLPLLLVLSALPSLWCQVTTGGSGSSVVINSGYSTSWLYIGPFEDESDEFTFSPSTLQAAFAREGAAYGDEGEEFGYLVGGVTNLRTGTGLAYADINLLDFTTNTFSTCATTLGSGLYYGQGEWNEAGEQLLIYGGISNSPSPGQPEVYSNLIYTLQFPTPISCTGLTVSSKAVTAMPGRKFHSIEIIDGAMYVFGGYNAITPLTQSQLFFSINPTSGAVTPLNTASPYFPIGIIEPAILEDEGEEILFFYSGLSAPPGVPGSAFPPAGTLYRYSWESNTWLTPITPQIGSSSESLLAYPQFTYSCHTHTVDDEHWFFAGGQDGLNNSLDEIVHFDMSTDSTIGVPTITILYSELPIGIEHCSIALGLGGELVIYTGFSQGAEASPSSSYPTTIFLAELPWISPSLVPDPYTSLQPPVDATAEWILTGNPAYREGAAYGTDGTNVYMAGGAILTAGAVLALTDVWALNAPTDRYISYSTTLPGPTYFGTSLWYNSALYVWGGRTNTQGSGALNSYNANLYKISFSSSPPAASTVTLTGSLVSSLQGTQHASSIQLGGKMYVWGGTNGLTGFGVPASGQQWFSINLGSGALNPESTSTCSIPCDVPTNVWVNPVLFTSAAGRYIYFYSGMAQDYATWGDAFDIFIYDTVGQSWLPDVEPLVGAYTSITPQFPNMAFGAVTVSSDGNHVLIVGGTEGDASPNGAGSHSKIFHIDATPFLADQINGRPIISCLPATLPAPLESAVAGLTQNNGEIIVFGGARYFNSELSYPIAYSSRLLEIIQPSLELLGSTVVSTTSSSCSGSSLSGGQIAGIVVGSILGTALIVGFIVYLVMRDRSGTGRRWSTQKDSGSEMA